MNEYNAGLDVLKILHKNGYDAYFVGGYVRDTLLNIPTHDIDMTSNAKPEEICSIFKAIPTGIKYGTVTIMHDGYTFEHTTFRSDGAYKDSRHPSEIVFSKDIKEDVLRRDFTINSLLLNYKEEVIDYLGGKKDLEDKLIRAIGDPDKRFNEDALRILRAISFVSKLGFDIEDNTLKSIIANKDLLKNVKVERIRVEFDKISKGKYREKAWKLFYDLNLNESFDNMDNILDKYDLSFEQILAIYLKENEDISPFWQISASNIRKYKKASKLAKMDVSDYELFIAGYDAALIGYTIYHNDFNTRWENLEIKSLKDIKLETSDLCGLIGAKRRGKFLDYISKKILNKTLDNNKESILKEVEIWNTLE